MSLQTNELAQTKNMLFLCNYCFNKEEMEVYPSFKFELDCDTIPCWMLLESCGQAGELFSRVCLNKTGNVYLTKIGEFLYPQLKTTQYKSLIYKPELTNQIGPYVQTKVTIYRKKEKIAFVEFTHYYYE